jgi:hypothetical protein
VQKLFNFTQYPLSVHALLSYAIWVDIHVFLKVFASWSRTRVWLVMYATIWIIYN